MANLFAIPVLWAVGTFWGGFALAQLWSWFVVPLGVLPITYAHAAGLQMTLLLFMASRGVNASKFDATRALIVSLILPAFALAFGWCVHWLMLHA